MFLGELMCLFVYFGKKLICPKKARTEDSEVSDVIPLSPGAQMAQSVQLKTNINPALLAIPASFDFCGSTLMFVALTQCAASVYQMMRGIIVVITAGMAMIFLGRKQYLHHYISLLIIVLAVAGVGLVGIAVSNKLAADKSDSGEEADPGATTTPLGVILLLVAQCFTGGQFVVEEKLLGGYYLDPLYVVGLEGFWGCVIYSIVLPSFQQVKDCSNAMCNYGYLEDSKLAFQQMGENKILIVQSVGIIISIAAFNATGVAITKYASAAQMSTIETCRTLLIWIISLMMKDEKFLVPLSFGQLAGFAALVLGTLIYKEIWIVPFEPLSKNTKRELEKRNNNYQINS